MADNGEAVLIIAASETDPNIYYASRFWAPDPFVYVKIGGRSMLVMSDLEVDRAKSESSVDEVLSFSRLQAKAKADGSPASGMLDVLEVLFKQGGVRQIRVPATFPVSVADRLRARGYTLSVGPDPFFPQRMIKTREEVDAIRETQRRTEEAVHSAIEVIRQAEIRGDELWLRGQPLTSELIRKMLHLALMGSDCLGRETIVAGGVQACDPHCIGFGTLKANQPIVLDVFPVSMKSRYYADMTRTVVRGKASDKIKRMFELVREGQEIAFGMIKAGVDGKAVHDAINAQFEKNGFTTGEVNGRMQGFFHGTGHGVGLEIHEAPRISTVSDILQAGQVVTVEPGLYYPDAGGGIRLEDMVLVTETGCENLTKFPKFLELN